MSESKTAMLRSEVLCGRCNVPPRQVFEDGTPPAGPRFHMNSASPSIAPEEG